MATTNNKAELLRDELHKYIDIRIDALKEDMTPDQIFNAFSGTNQHASFAWMHFQREENES